MAIYWAGNEDIDFGATVATGFNSTTSPLFCRSEFVRGAMMIYGGGYLTSPTSTDYSSIWYGEQRRFATLTADSPIISFLRDGVEIFRIAVASITTRLCIHVPSLGITQVGSISTTTAALTKLDVYYTSGFGSRIQLFVNGAQDSVVIGVDSLGYVDGVKLQSGTPTGSSYVSECVLASEDTRNLAIKTIVPAGSGGSWVGNFTQINEMATSTSTVVESSLAGQTLTCGTGTIASRYAVKQLRMSALCSTDATGPSGISFGLYQTPNSFDYAVLAPGFREWFFHRRAWDLNPTTGLPWTVEDFDAAATNFAFRSET